MPSNSTRTSQETGRPTPTDLQLVQAVAGGAYRSKGLIVRNGQETDLPGDVSVTRIGDPAKLERITQTEGIVEMVVTKGCENHPKLVRDLVQLSYQGVLLSEPVTFYERSMSRLPWP